MPAKPAATAMPCSHHGRVRRPAVATFVILAAAALVLGGCSSDKKSSGPTTTAKVEIGQAATVTSGAKTSKTTTSTATTATTAVAGPTGTPGADQAAAALYAAWKGGDRTAAGTVADPVAVEGIFAATPGDYALYNKCNTGEFGSAECLYRGSGGTIQFRMTQRGPNWVVASAFFSND